MYGTTCHASSACKSYGLRFFCFACTRSLVPGGTVCVSSKLKNPSNDSSDGRHKLIMYGINTFNVFIDYSTKKHQFYILNPFGKISSTLKKLSFFVCTTYKQNSVYSYLVVWIVSFLADFIKIAWAGAMFHSWACVSLYCIPYTWSPCTHVFMFWGIHIPTCSLLLPSYA